MNANKSVLMIISAITFISPISAFSEKPTSRAEFDATVQQLQDQINITDANVSQLKSEIGIILKELHDQIAEEANNQSHAKVEIEATIKNLQDQITSITKAQSHTYSVGEKALGGTVIFVTPNGQHGVVMADADILQGSRDGVTSWFDIRNRVNDPANYIGTMAQNYYDWRLPTTKELMDECNRNPQSFAEGGYFWTNDITRFALMQMGDQVAFMLNLVSARGGQCQAVENKYRFTANAQSIYVRPVHSF